MKAIPIIWLPQDISGVHEESDRSARHTPFFENESANDISMKSSADSIPLWRQNEVRRQRFRRRQLRFNDQCMLSSANLQSANDRRAESRRILPRLPRTNSPSARIEREPRSRSTVFFPKVRLSPHKPTSPSLLSDVLKTRPLHLQPKGIQEFDFQTPRSPTKSNYGRHYRLPSLKKQANDDD